MALLNDLASAFFLLVGLALMGIAALGIVRMPDLFMRMSAATKASTVGASSMLIGAAIHFSDQPKIAAQVVVTILFLLLTAPVGAHVIGRAAYRKNEVDLYERTGHDDLEDYYSDES